jgi:hypothetical protein
MAHYFSLWLKPPVCGAVEQGSEKIMSLKPAHYSRETAVRQSFSGDFKGAHYSEIGLQVKEF